MALEEGWIVSIILGAALFVIVILIIIWFMYYSKRHHHVDVPTDPGSSLNHDKWDALLKSIEDEKRKESNSYLTHDASSEFHPESTFPT